MANTSTPTRGPAAAPPTTEVSPENPAHKDDKGHHDKHPHHYHHEPRIIHPASSGTSHLDPGSINIKP